MTEYATIDHAGAGSDVVERKARRIAESFVRDDEMERFLELRKSDPDRFASLRLAPRTLLALDYYAAARKVASELASGDEDDAA